MPGEIFQILELYKIPTPALPQSSFKSALLALVLKRFKICSKTLHCGKGARRRNASACSARVLAGVPYFTR